MTIRDQAFVDRVATAQMRNVAPMWPLDRAIAVNPWVAETKHPFVDTLVAFAHRFGADPWPSAPSATRAREWARPLTLLERVDPSLGDRARRALGNLLLEATATTSSTTVAARAAAILRRHPRSVGVPKAVAIAWATLLEQSSLTHLVERLATWSDEEIGREFGRHVVRLSGWAAWSNWSDRTPHPRHLEVQSFFFCSLALDLAWTAQLTSRLPAPELIPISAELLGGVHRLDELERSVHGGVLDALRSQPSPTPIAPVAQFVFCIDVRSSAMRCALESEGQVTTYGFAGFFGLFAQVVPDDGAEPYDAFPVIAGASGTIVGGDPASTGDLERTTLGGVLSELTHEPSAMFAVAEVAGVVSAPWVLGRNVGGLRRRQAASSGGRWRLEVEDRVAVAASVLAGIGLTANFAPTVVMLGHHATTTNNPHAAALECGACAGHRGGPNAAAVVELLNDAAVRRGLEERGIFIPPSTRFVAGEHDTTRQVIELFDEVEPALQEIVTRAGQQLAAQTIGGEVDAVAAQRRLDRRARDWAETRPEWGLAGNAAFIVGPRSSTRGVDLGRTCFLHSYDADQDASGAVLAGIMAAPVVVAEWINAAYYGATSLPDLLGAGDKTLHNPVGDFAVLVGDDPDLRVGLPWQSVADGTGLVHQPVRLLVAIEAPISRIEQAINATPLVADLVNGAWIHVVGREAPTAPWQRREPSGTWVLDAERSVGAHGGATC